jgi:serine/threonine protein phosphatase PrpC
MKSQEPNWEVSALSETGYVREENQDRMSRVQMELGHLYVVADGMGGHKGGALAAQLTVEGLQQHLSKAQPGSSVEDAITEAFEKTNHSVYKKAHSGDPATDGMGSTAVLLLASESGAYIAHVGDSRAYLYREGRLCPLTTDHTEVQRMIAAGMLTSEEARDHPKASVLNRAIGNKPNVKVDIHQEKLRDRDAILLCSDGLSGYVDDREIESVLRKPITVQEIPRRLFKLAINRKSEDNVTVQFIQYGQRVELQQNKKPFLQWIAVVTVGVAMLAGLAYYLLIPERAARESANIIGLEQKLNQLETTLNNTVNTLDDLRKNIDAPIKTLTTVSQRTGKLKKNIETIDSPKRRGKPKNFAKNGPTSNKKDDHSNPTQDDESLTKVTHSEAALDRSADELLQQLNLLNENLKDATNNLNAVTVNIKKLDSQLQETSKKVVAEREKNQELLNEFNKLQKQDNGSKKKDQRMILLRDKT